MTGNKVSVHLVLQDSEAQRAEEKLIYFIVRVIVRFYLVFLSG